MKMNDRLWNVLYTTGKEKKTITEYINMTYKEKSQVWNKLSRD
jgi:hypothetical protein